MKDTVDPNRILQSFDSIELAGKYRRQLLLRFIDHVMADYRTYGRTFPWRETHDTYRVLLSELMLQQTQTSRVQPKYLQFVEQWPSFENLAGAQLVEVLRLWRGLGYNRRALALVEIAKRSEAYGWSLPDNEQLLRSLPMVGPSTAAAIQSFCYGRKVIYLETNIRRALIHQFFVKTEQVPDSLLRSVLQELIQLTDDSRSWYYALMDYGVLLRTLSVNPNKRSRHYVKQGKFEQSNRQLRGLLLIALTEQGPTTKTALCRSLPFEPERVEQCLHSLVLEGFIEPRISEGVAESEIRYGIVTEFSSKSEKT